MMRYVLTIFVLLIAAGCTGGGDGGGAPSGKQIYDTNCLACHGAAGKGDGPAGAALVPPASDFTDAEWTHGSSLSEIENTISDGVPDTAMIAWQDLLAASEIKSVAEYVKSLS
ncbi:MAG: c-type cytochrome [Candidatus Hydrothermarchaeales archaeon]